MTRFVIKRLGRRQHHAGLSAGSFHRVLVGIDVIGSGSRAEDVQLYVREAMYQILERAFDNAGVGWHTCRSVDRGDGAIVALPPEISSSCAVDSLILHLHAVLRRHNRVVVRSAEIRLRMAVHAGLLHFDDNGVGGDAIVHLSRLLDAPRFKAALALTPSDLGTLVSDHFYCTVIRSGAGLIDPDMYISVPVVLKETRCTAWLYLPPSRAMTSIGTRSRANGPVGRLTGQKGSSVSSLKPHHRRSAL